MDQQKRQPAKNLLDIFSPEDRAKAKLNADRREERRKNKVTSEWFLLSELGHYYGFDAIRAVLDDYIDLDQARMLIDGARRMHSADIYDNAIANLAAKATKISRFKRIMKKYIDDMKEIK